MLIYCLIVLRYRIPFIDDNYYTLAAFMCNSGNLGILLGYAFRSINDNKNNISTLNSRYCTYYAVTFDFFLNLILAAETCCINKYIISSVITDFGINGIPCGAGNIRYDNSVLSA